MTNDFSPTAESYADFQTAYAALNMALFGGDLPDVMFTLARSRHANGYIIPEGFSALTDSSKIAEIGLNPSTFAHRTPLQILSTIAHEMVHFAQYLDGAMPANGYHDKDFARRMCAIGLWPSSTGKPGGRTTGFKMSHYIVPGPFETVASDLIAKGWTVRYTSPIETEADRTARARRNASKTRYVCLCGARIWGRPGLTLTCSSDGHPPLEMTST